jgi:hypothetical protein
MKIIKNLNHLTGNISPPLTSLDLSDRNPADRDWVITSKYDGNDIIKIDITSSKTISYAKLDVESNTIIDSTETILYSNSHCAISVSKLRSEFYDHAAFVIFTETKNLLETNQLETGTFVIDLFKMTQPSKLNLNDIYSLQKRILVGALIVPYANCTNDELIFMLKTPQIWSSKQVTLEGFSEQMEDIPIGIDWKKTLYPSLTCEDITMNVSSSKEFQVNLSEPREGVTIYLENTGGVLDSNRAATNQHGIATFTLTVGEIPTNFKLKAGFKYFSGLIDIPVTVS